MLLVIRLPSIYHSFSGQQLNAMVRVARAAASRHCPLGICLAALEGLALARAADAFFHFPCRAGFGKCSWQGDGVGGVLMLNFLRL